jgi:hypothetical protein
MGKAMIIMSVKMIMMDVAIRPVSGHNYPGPPSMRGKLTIPD